MADWKTAPDTAEQIEKPISTLYRWLAKPAAQTGIETTIREDGQMLVDVDTVTAYRDSIKRGRPRKS